MRTNRERPFYQEGTSWEIQPIEADSLADFKRLFLKLHLFNASLDPRFALDEDWERHFDMLVAATPDTRQCLALLARDQGRPAGFVLASVHRDSPLWRHREWAEVEALYVERAWRGAGLADELLARALNWAAELSLPSVQLFVTATNARALRFYERQGFRPAQAILRRMLPAGSVGRSASLSAGA
jgi:GNAT superfamily N-acetyltransferase